MRYAFRSQDVMFASELGNSAARSGGAISDEHQRSPVRLARPGIRGLVADQVHDGVVPYSRALRERVIETRIHGARDFVHGAPTKRVVRVR